MRNRRSLADRIFIVLFVFSFAMTVCAGVAVMAVCFTAYESQEEDLLLSQAESYAESLQGETEGQMIEHLEGGVFAEVRCTLVARDGSVLYDSFADPSTLGNHAGREEILHARESGHAVVMRNSETLGIDTLYAACSVSDGVVLRLAETRTSLASLLPKVVLPVGAALATALAVSFAISRYLTELIVRPLRDIDLARPLENDAYEELQPLLGRVDEQRRALELHNDELERAVIARREFTGNVSHEMKTPLQVIGGYAELIEAGVPSAEDTRKFAGLIRSESQAMTALINDVLTLSRLDERIELGSRKTTVELAQVAKRVALRLSTQAQERGIVVELQLDEGAHVIGDEALAEQMIYNLVDNAIRYNKPSGRVVVRVSSGDREAFVSVSDEGPGIPEDQRERIFERFYRVEASRSRETGGTGLGLAIVKHAVEVFGGTVEVSDASSGGALFRLRMPRA